MIRLTASFGVAGLAPDETMADPALLRADTAAYEAKRGGRNRTVTAA